MPEVFNVANTFLRLLTVVRLNKPRINRYAIDETPILLWRVVGDLANKAKDEL